MAQITVSVCHGADSKAAPNRTTTASASKRMLARSLSDDQLKVATLDTIISATKAIHGATSHGERNQSSPLQNQQYIGSIASNAPAGAGTPVRKPADLCGCSVTSILALNRARRSAQNTARISAQIQPTLG